VTSVGVAMRRTLTDERVEIVAPAATVVVPVGPPQTRRRWHATAVSLAFAAREGATSFCRNGLMSVAAVLMIFVTLLAFGAAILVLQNLHRVAAAAEEQVLAVAYLRDGLNTRQRTNLANRLRGVDGVATVRFVSRAEALRRLEQSLGGRVNVRDVVRANPLPDSMEIHPERPGDLPAIAEAARAVAGVADVVAGEEITGRIDAAARFVRLAGGVAAAVLALVAIIVILNTLRLTIVARRTDIEIMRLVGATASFVRRPFFVEGMIQGGVAAMAAVVSLGAAYWLFVTRATAAWPFLRLVPAAEAMPVVAIALVVVGLAVGALGTAISVARFLRTR